MSRVEGEGEGEGSGGGDDNKCVGFPREQGGRLFTGVIGRRGGGGGKVSGVIPVPCGSR